MTLAIVDSRAGIRIDVEALRVAQVDLASYLAEVVYSIMRGSGMSVAANGEIRFLRAHAPRGAFAWIGLGVEGLVGKVG